MTPILWESEKHLHESWQLIINSRYDNDTPLQPQSERLKRRRQWGGPRENHAGVRFPWSLAASRPIYAPFCYSFFRISRKEAIL